MNHRRIVCLSRVSLIFILVALFWCALPGSASAQTVPADEPNNLIRHEDFATSLEKTLEEEQNICTVLEEQLQELRRTRSALDDEFNMVSIQVSTYNNLLLLPSIPVDDLERIQESLKSSIGALKKRLEVVSQKQQDINASRLKTEEQNVINENQLNEIKKKVTKNGDVKELLPRFKKLAAVLVKKQELLEKLYEGHSYRIEKLGEIEREYSALSEKFNRRITERKQQVIFEKHSGLSGQVSPEKIGAEVKRISQAVMRPLSRQFWVEQVFSPVKSRLSLLVALLLSFGIFLMLILRMSRYLKTLEEKEYFRKGSWRHLTLRVFQNSLILFGIALLAYVCTRTGNAFLSVPLTRAVAYGLLLWLFSQWVHDVMVFGGDEGLLRIPPPLSSYLKALIIMVRAFGIPYIAVVWLIGSQGGLLVLLRLTFAVLFILWSILFHRALHQTLSPALREAQRPPPLVKFLMICAAYSLAGVGFFLELFGYGQFAFYWYESWVRTATVLIWSGLVFAFLREWKRELAAAVAAEKGDHHIDYPARWFVIQLSWIILAAAFFVGLLMAWGLKQTVILGIFSVLSRPLTVGGMSISLPGILFALLVLLFTHGATRVWRQLLLNRILVGSGLQRGVQESVASITVYLFWFFGIILSLHVLGVKTTSIAIAFGALGVGLGFGLQAIFNNFVSGIILLFERPIQVGDVIELDGTWGTITRINVRSTVVQTFDNASLIIPNSEFISNKLTNWSFKDLRVRRTVTVGVAYGSDVKLVRQTLSEIAESNSSVYKRPKHDVLFKDFGDSALRFDLRVWTHIDTCLTAETEIRFEIDRLFRERNIEIAFPQLDIHVRSIEGHDRPDVKGT